jgi:hydrogenase maturation protein HypF
MNRHGLRRGTLYHAPETIPARGKNSLNPLRHNSAPLSHESALQRRRITVQGIVQGAGFRSFVSTLAQRWGLSGHVLNDSTGAIVEVQGIEPSIEGFLDALLTDVPPLSHIDAINTEIIPVSPGESSFVVVQHD